MITKKLNLNLPNKKKTTSFYTYSDIFSYEYFLTLNNSGLEST